MKVFAPLMTTIAELGTVVAREQAAAGGSIPASTPACTAPVIAPATDGAVAR
jgi:hypothetical protein